MHASDDTFCVGPFMSWFLDEQIESTDRECSGIRFVEYLPIANPANRCRTQSFLILTVLSFLIASGCRSGKQVKDAEYCPVRSVAKTSWCPGPSDSAEAQYLVGSERAALIDEGLNRQNKPNDQLPFESQREQEKTDESAVEDEELSGKKKEDSKSDKSGDPNDEDEQDKNSEAGNETETETGAKTNSKSDDAEKPVDSSAVESNGLGLPDLIRFALDQNPEIAIARKEIEIACAKIPQAASLADPMVDVISWPISSNAQQTAGGRMTAEIMLSQEVPWKGKRESRVGQAAREVNRLQNQKSAVELKVANEVKQAWYDYWLVNENIEISKEDLAFLNDLLERAKVMYEGGTIGQQDLLRLQSEIGLNSANLANLEAELTQAHAELLRVLNWSPEQLLSFKTSICEIEHTAIPDRAAVLAQATAASPELQAIWAEVQRDQWKVTESRLEYYPDLKFSAGWGGMTTRNALAPTADGVDNIIAGVSFNLPVRIAARDAALRESESQVVKGLRDWERFRNQTERDVVRLHADLVSLKAQLAAYQTQVVPQLNDALELMVANYEVDKTDLGELIGLRREILQLRGIELELSARWCQARADLAMLMAEVDW